jgi:hypothetical protein
VKVTLPTTAESVVTPLLPRPWPDCCKVAVPEKVALPSVDTAVTVHTPAMFIPEFPFPLVPLLVLLSHPKPDSSSASNISEIPMQCFIVIVLIRKGVFSLRCFLVLGQFENYSLPIAAPTDSSAIQVSRGVGNDTSLWKAAVNRNSAATEIREAMEESQNSS